MKSHVHVKICGITRPRDALFAAELGARYVGFVFAKGSPRYIEPIRAGEIIELLPEGVIPVGVFVNQPRDRVLDIISTAGIKVAQFHGLESPEYCASFGAFPVIKAFRVRPSFGIEDVLRYHVGIYLLDAYHPDKPGGTGERFDWSIAAPIAREVRVMLAGGLTPENVVEAIETVHPYAVDVSSGVEAEPGIKDHRKVEEFFLNMEAAGYHTIPPREEKP